MFLTEATAPAAVFPQATTFERTVVPSTPELRAQMQTQLGTLRPSLWEPEYIIFTAKQRDVLLGYGVIVEEIGKSLPITFIVGVRQDGKVADVAVMAYREPYGDGIRAERFRKQFVGRSAQSRFRAGEDIDAVSGATISSHSMCVGVQRATALFEETVAKLTPAVLATR